jgi:hypothetical protein
MFRRIPRKMPFVLRYWKEGCGMKTLALALFLAAMGSA